MMQMNNLEVVSYEVTKSIVAMQANPRYSTITLITIIANSTFFSDFQGCRGNGNSHGNGNGMGMGTVMNSHGNCGNSVGIFEADL